MPEGGALVEVTLRTIQSRLLLRPGPAVNEIILGVLGRAQTVCREKLRGSVVTVRDPKTGRDVERIAEHLLTADDVKAAFIIAGREGEDVCAPFLEKRSWWSRLAYWR